MNTGASRRRLFWRAYARCYDIAWDSPITGTVVADLSEMKACQSVVDLGCGTGLFAESLTRRGATVVGVDSSPHMLTKALETKRITRAICSDAAHTPFGGSSFDGAVCANLLHLHPEPGRLIREAVRLVRPGGLIAWVTPTPALDQAAAFDGDISSGRGSRASLKAFLVRTIVSPLACISGVRVRAAEQVLGLVEKAYADKEGVPVLELVRSQAYFGSQILIVTRKVG